MQKILVIIVVIAISFCGCTQFHGDSSVTNEDNPSVKTTIDEDDSSEYDQDDSSEEIIIVEDATYKLIDTKYEEGAISINYPQILGMKDLNLQDEINSILEKDAIDNIEFFLSDKNLKQYELTYIIHLQSERVFSVQYDRFISSEMESHPQNDSFSTNIDMLNAKRITLTDLIIESDKLFDLLDSGAFQISEYDIIFTKDQAVSILEEHNEWSEKKSFKNVYQKSDIIEGGLQSELYSYLTNDSLGMIFELALVQGSHMSIEMKYSDLRDVLVKSLLVRDS